MTKLSYGSFSQIMYVYYFYLCYYAIERKQSDINSLI